MRMLTRMVSGLAVFALLAGLCVAADPQYQPIKDQWDAGNVSLAPNASATDLWLRYGQVGQAIADLRDNGQCCDLSELEIKLMDISGSLFILEGFAELQQQTKALLVAVPIDANWSQKLSSQAVFNALTLQDKVGIQAEVAVWYNISNVYWNSCQVFFEQRDDIEDAFAALESLIQDYNGQCPCCGGN